jgi:hypothetical protein
MAASIRIERSQHARRRVSGWCPPSEIRFIRILAVREEVNIGRRRGGRGNRRPPPPFPAQFADCRHAAYGTGALLWIESDLPHPEVAAAGGPRRR